MSSTPSATDDDGGLTKVRTSETINTGSNQYIAGHWVRPYSIKPRRPSTDSVTIVVLIAGSAISAQLGWRFDWKFLQTWGPAVGLTLIGALVGFFIPWLKERREYMKNQNASFNESLKAQKEYEREILEKLKKETELATLMGLNQGQIDRYHEIVTEQADKAFKSSRTAMGVGLLLLVCAAIAGAYVPLEQVRWFIGALAAFSTMLSGYLTKTYLALYKESIGQLNRYFDQPVLNSHYLTAERLAEALDPPDAVEVRRQIINEVLAASSKVGTRNVQQEPKKSRKRVKPRRPTVPKQAPTSTSNVQST